MIGYRTPAGSAPPPDELPEWRVPPARPARVPFAEAARVLHLDAFRKIAFMVDEDGTVPWVEVEAAMRSCSMPLTRLP